LWLKIEKLASKMQRFAFASKMQRFPSMMQKTATKINFLASKTQITQKLLKDFASLIRKIQRHKKIFD
jgi:16S rRNA G527 N7-methylase RsmG